MKKTTFLILFSFLCANFIVSAQYQTLELDIYKLENGLTVILNPDPNQNKVYGGVVVKAGSKHDPADHTGIAHYLEHMLFKGTDMLGTSNYDEEKPLLDRISLLYEELNNTPDEETREEILRDINKTSVEAGKYAIPTEFDNLVRSIGGTGLNAFTGDEITFYFNAFPSHQMGKWLHLYSHRFINPVFRLFQSELEVVYEEKNMYNDNFITGVFETFMENLYKNHPYGQQTTIGSTEHLRTPSLKRMYEFYRTYYVPNNMALILTGNFDMESTKSHIDELFRVWEYGDIPEFPVYEEKPFQGREVVTERLSPIKLGVMGFRTVPNNHPDEAAIDVSEKILSNNAQTGLLDKLVLDNDLMFAGTLPLGRNNDHGAAVVLFIPKVIGQSLNRGERIVLNAIEKLRKGDFDEAVLEAAKNEIYIDFLSSLENAQMRLVLLARAFSHDRDINEFLHYPKSVQDVTKEDVLAAAEKYFNTNYFVLHSKMGFPRKEKLEKPGFDPIQPDENAVSPFAEAFEGIPSKEPVFKPVSFERDITTVELMENVRLYHVHNPMNDIYSFRYKIGVGSYDNPVYRHVAQIMNYAGTEKKSVEELKKAFHNIGTTYYFSANNSYITIELRGLEQHLPEALLLLNELLTSPLIENNKTRLITNEERAMRRLEDKEPADIARALVQYVRRGENSTFLNRLSMREIRRLRANRLADLFKVALKYETEIHYSGSLYPADELSALVSQSIKFNDALKKSASPVHIRDNSFDKNTVYFVNDRNAIQSQIYFLVNGELFTPELKPYYEAFNAYFGGGFSGLVVQEIREYRSMAYATGAQLTIPNKALKPAFFTGYIGTQADKTNEALDVFMSLFRDMPVKEERIGNLRSSLTEEIFASKPDFRQLSERVVAWQHQGFKTDPGKNKLELFQSLSFDDIVSFHKENLKDKPVVICIVGDKRKLDMNHISQYGDIVELKKRHLYR